MIETKYENLTRVCISSLLCSLEPLSDFIYENEQAFIEEFVSPEAISLSTLGFTPEGCYIRCNTSWGKEVVNITTEELIEWMIEVDTGLSI